MGLPSASTTACILVLRPPRERPISWFTWAFSAPFLPPLHAGGPYRRCCRWKHLACPHRRLMTQISFGIRHPYSIAGNVRFSMAQSAPANPATANLFLLSITCHLALPYWAWMVSPRLCSQVEIYPLSVPNHCRLFHASASSLSRPSPFFFISYYHISPFIFLSLVFRHALASPPVYRLRLWILFPFTRFPIQPRK